MSDPDSLLARPSADRFVSWPDGLGRRFMLFVDTEEEFDWSAPFDRNATNITAIPGLVRAQAYFRAAGVAPVYLTDYPVLESEAASALLGLWQSDGTAAVGAHLHPWVTPPHEEAVNVRNSFVGNLDADLERRKLAALCDLAERRMGRRPVIYRAGRYGIGPDTGRLLRDAGFLVDCSVRSRFDYSDQHGPDFRGMPLRPYRAGPDGALLEVPLSAAYVGVARVAGGVLERLANRMPLAKAAAARLRLCARIPLTPEGVDAPSCIAAINALLADGLPLLSFSFHSPTLEPGHTPYARTAADVDAFYRWWDMVLAHLDRRGVRPMSLDELLAATMPAPSRNSVSEQPCQAARRSANASRLCSADGAGL